MGNAIAVVVKELMLQATSKF